MSNPKDHNEAHHSVTNHSATHRLLQAWREGSSEAQTELWPRLCEELHNLTLDSQRARDQGDPKPTGSLLHQACLRLLGSEVAADDRRRFFTLAARALRFVLADAARRQGSNTPRGRRFSGLGSTLSAMHDPLTLHPEETLAVHRTLNRLTTMHPRHEKLVELRYFAGLSIEEAAEILAVTPRVVVRDWQTVRVWLLGEIQALA